MMRLNQITGRLALVFVAGSSLNALASPREPLPPLPEFAPVLFHESFDQRYACGVTNAGWVLPDYGTLVESWSGYALQRASLVTPFVVTGLDAAGRTNVATEGALRFWVKPYWTSAPDGKGAGTEARLVELAVAGGRQAVAVWWLQVNSTGTVVSLMEQSDSGPVTLLKAEINWQAGQWHQIVLNYGEQTALAIDGEISAEGDGLVKVPPQVSALVWGSRLTGADSLEGELEELFTFTRPLESAFHYSALKNQAALGPISPVEAQALAAASAKGTAGPGGASPMLRLVGGTAECLTNVPVYITNLVSTCDSNQGWTVTFDIQGSYDGATTALYDVFTTTNLIGDNITNSQWLWLEQGPGCNTYQYTNQPTDVVFYILGTPLDTDGDGLTDAFENLVSKTDPTKWDTDGDGISDGMELALGFDPLHVNEPAQSGNRLNYTYDSAAWLNQISGVKSGTVSLDAEGNVTQVSQ